MATEVDLQKLVVQLEASFVKYDRAWSKAMGETDANVKRVSSKFDTMSKSINNAGANTARALDPIAGQTGNIAAQFQDIAVQLQGGQSPFLIAMQQGTQLSAVLNQSKTPIAALSSAFLQMVNPISLATIAAIALGGAAVQYLGTLLGEGKSATEVIKEQNDVIRRVAENWGDAVPAIKAYVDQLDRAAERRDLEQAVNFGVTQAFEELRAKIPDLRADLAAARTDIENVGGTAQEIDQLQAVFDDLRDRIESGTAGTAELDAVMAQLAGTTGSTTVPTLITLQGVLAAVRAELAASARQAADFTAAIAIANSTRIRGNAREGFNSREFLADQERINGLTAEQLALENEITRVKSEAERADALITDAQALSIAQERLAAEERRSQIASSNKSAAKEVDREREAVLELIQELEHEYSLINLTAEQKAVANALRRAGAAATDEERAAIEALVLATEDERTRIQDVQDAYAEMGRAAETAVRGIVDALADGKIEAGELGDILKNIGSQLISTGLSSLFGTGGLFSFGGARASGGPVKGGQTYLVGEKGPELFTPPASGRIVANDQLGGGGGSFTFAPTIDARGADVAAVARLEGVLQKQQAEFTGRVKDIVRTKGTKWR